MNILEEIAERTKERISREKQLIPQSELIKQIQMLPPTEHPGFLENLQLFALTLVMAIPLGLIITLGSMSRIKPLRWLVRTFIWIIRGTPLMLQLFVVLYAPGLLFDYPMSNRFLAAIVAFVINYSCYFSETNLL